MGSYQYNIIYIINIRALLTGHGLEVYSRIPSGKPLDYYKLKEALLKRYQLTEEGFHSKFSE